MSNYSTIKQIVMHYLFPAWEQNIPTLGTKYSHVGNKTGFCLAISLLLMLVLGVNSAWGQDYSGTYYIKSNNDNAFYLCTSTVFYDGNHYANSGDMPYLTTATSGTIGTMDDAVWRIIKAESGNYYYVVHAVDGKYLTLNDDPTNFTNNKDQGNRLSLHLQYLKDEDNSLFIINKTDNWYNISPKNKSNWSPNPAGDNYDTRAGTNNKTQNIPGAGNGKNVGGIIGLWLNTDDKSKWQFEAVESKPICEAPIFTNNGTLSISSSTEGATVYYTTNKTIPTTSSSSGSITGDIEDIDVIWARATTQDSEPYYWSTLSIYEIPQCAKPIISIINGKLNLSCATDGVTFYYTINGLDPTTEYDPNNKPDATDNDIIKAVATKNGYHKSKVASVVPSQTVHNTSEMDNMLAHYILASDFVVSSSVGTEAEPFRGIIDGGFNTLSDFDKALVAYANGATIKNVILDNVTIGENENGYAGAICNEASGDTRIYNCGVKSGTISGTNAGSIVGKLDGYARVINCYSFATVSGTTWGAGIVGYNSFSSTRSDLRTMVMNCMFYGEVSSNSKLSPIYGGNKITNVSNLNGYNYYRFDANYSRSNSITDYNCALAAEEKFLTRFEFFRNILNSNRELAAWYATDDPSKGKGVGNACEMAKWVLDPADKPYPILKTQDYYPSFINYEDAPTLGTISLTINESNTTTGGATKPTGASINSNYPTTLTVYDKDLAHKHFNYRTVRLPYYNEVGTGNCTKNKVVTGWKITGFTNGTQGHFVKNVLDYSGTTHDEDEYPPYNFADRYCTDKDKYSVSGRVFSQGAYYDVPEGVTGITIEPYWGTAVYLSDPTYDVAYPYGYGNNNANAVFVSNMGNRYVGGNTASINDDNQTVYTDYASAFGQVSSSGTVYDNAIVLVGNYHHYWGPNSPSATKAFTIMSADLNNDCEPDYGFIVQHGTNRQDISAIRFDFINSPGLGMIQKVETDKAIPKHGIWCPKGWFEVTNTTLIQFTQFEYDKGGKSAGSPLILLGGIYDQFVTARYGAANSTEYIHLGSNVWMKEFCNGTHTANATTPTTRHIPISVTGGEFESFYLTGTFRPSVESVTDNAECYINGGKFGDMAGAGQEQLKGDVTWLIDHADITNFYGGGINDQKPVTGHVYVEINNSQVGLYCGGPKFGNMQNGKKVTTKAKGSTFGNFYGAGYGGTSYFRDMTKDKTGENDWDTWVDDYTRKYVAGKGISTEYECEFIPFSGGESGQADFVGRFYVLYASLSLAETKNVESTLEDCNITGSFYGGGKLGRVDGNITSTLKNCTVGVNVYGAGFSASVEKVNVITKGTMMKTNPAYNESVGVFTDGTYPDGIDYTWTHAASVSEGNEFDDTNYYIYTTTDLTTLGTVIGNVTLNIEGSTSVTGSVYGGGEESNVTGSTQVNISGGTITHDVFGGGKGVADNFTCDKAMVGVNDDGKCEDPGSEANKDKGTIVNISNGTVNGNVYGGGEVGRVEWNTQVTIGAVSGEGTPVINGSVFGAGAGVETHGYGALVRGNSSVTIQGNAKVRDNVYGGGEQATVGRYWVKGIQTDLCPDDENETVVPPAPEGLPDEMPYKTRRGGKCTVIVRGSAQVGPDGGATETAGHVFGAGKGITPHYVHTGSKANWSRRMVDYNSTKHATGEGETWDYIEEYSDAEKSDANFKKYVWEYFANEDKYLEFLQTLALVTGTDVTIGGGAVKGNVYGGSESGFVQDDTDVKVTGGTIGTSGATTDGNVFGGGKGLAEFAEAGKVKGNTEVTISGGTAHGSVFGGGQRGITLGTVSVSMTGGTINQDVYGGGALADTNTGNWNSSYGSVAGITAGTTIVTGYYTRSGSGTNEDPYEYTEVTAANTVAAEETTYYSINSWSHATQKSARYTTTVSLTGGLIKGDAYGGGLGQKTGFNSATSNIAAVVWGDIAVTLNGTKFDINKYEDEGYTNVVKSGRVFGCNNLHGSPQGNVTVTVQRTVAGNTSRSETANKNNANATYEVATVYGGGNLADYTAAGMKTHVIINGCSDTSIQYVYGGGNAAAVPETDVDINAAYEIGAVFGGGNGKDKYKADNGWQTNPGANVSGNASTMIYGGTIHEAFGGSNEKGAISGTVSINTQSVSQESPDYCPLNIGKLYGAGKNADIEGDLIVVMGCMPGDENKTDEVYGGAENANVKGNVELTITSGSFGKVFGGNNTSGAIFGHIILNIEESGCTPIKIDELYLGGYNAAYSVYGYYQNGTIEGTDKPKYDPIAANDNTHTAVYFGDGSNSDHTKAPYAHPVLNVISATYIGQVFGGGLGSDAIIYGNPTVNINQTNPLQFSSYNSGTKETTYTAKTGDLGSIGEDGIFGGGNEASVYGNTTVNIGNQTTVDWTVLVLDDSGQSVLDANNKPLTQTITGENLNTVLGANITGDVFGGGNNAVVTGNTQVNICAVEGDDPATTDVTEEYTIVAPGSAGVTIQGTKPENEFGRGVFGGGNQGNVSGDSYVYFGGGSVNQTIYGGGCDADVLGNTHVTMLDGYVFDGVCGGGLKGSVGTVLTRTTVDGHGENVKHGDENCLIGKPETFKEGTGKCTVVITGGQVGPATVATLGMTRAAADGGPVSEGWVWGAGRGVVNSTEDDPDTDFRTYVNETDVTIGGTAFIMEGVIGGGEFGRVRGNTLVKIEGGQIGVGKDKAADGKPVRYTEEQWTTAETAVSAGNASSINAIAAAMPACSHFPYGRNTGTEQAPNWVYETYDPYADEFPTLYPGGSTAHASDGKTWIGCVFAGGSGYYPYKKSDNSGYDWLQSAGLVEGNTEVRISGGHILTNVYGGNEYTNVKGKCKITMTGGTIGVPRTLDQIKTNPMIGNIFGAGKGDPRVHFNKTTNVGEVEIEVTGGIIYGSVFGGGEDGHVLKDVSLTIGTDSHTGPTIGTWGTSYFEGNVFGGGRGFSGDAYTAGNVAGSVTLNIKGGSILGSVFGGGRLGSVGYGLFDEGVAGYGKMREDNDTEEGFAPSGGFTHGRGHIDITISGGTIGNNYEYDYIASTVTGNALTTAKANMPNTEHDAKNILTHTKGGNVFAGGMGRMYQLDGTTPISAVDWWKLGCVKSSKLTISGGTIKSCVYGGGELGQVVGKHTAKNAANEDVSVGTEVIITGGTIGTEIQDGGTTKYTFGSVFGGGYGSLAETLTHTGGKPVSYPKYIAGRVKAGTKVNMTAGAVKASVYGGGEMAAVGESTVLGETLTDGFSRDTHVIISGGTIGKTKDTEHNISYGGAKMGNVYGGGSGHNNTVRSGHVYGNTNVTISGTPTIYHNVYGGGAYGSVGEFDYSLDDTHKVNGINSLHTPGTGVARVTITGGTIGIDGKENGMVFGSSRGDINRPEERDDHTAWVYDTHVTIGDANGGPAIMGSVYGSGENGHTFNDAVVTVHSGTIGVPENPEYAYRGNVYGGGCGTDKYYENHDEETHDGNGQLYNPLAGVVYGNATVNITGGNVVRNVYGAGAMGSVGKTNTDGTISGGKTTVTISGGRVGVDGNGEGNGNGHVFGAARGEYGLDNSFSSVRESEVNIQYETTPDGDNEDKTEKLIAGSVFGGGEAGIVKESVTVNMKGGLVLKDVYGGGALANTQTNNWDATNNTWAADKIEEDGKTTYTTTVNLTGGSVGGDAYGGGLGQKTGFNGATSDIEATVYGDITVNLGKANNDGTPDLSSPATAFNISYENTDVKDDQNNYIQVVKSGRVFGCNNLNGSPQGNVTVNVYKTVEGNVARTASENYKKKEGEAGYVVPTYEVAAVYGGGNLANYTASGKKANVVIHSCDVSVQYVYGGGNAAAVPGTDVYVKGAWEIDHVFGGGNGKDKYKRGNEWMTNAGANVTGNTNTLLIGGYIHEAYGGSNEKGIITGNVTINTKANDPACVCDLDLEKLYGAGKNADIEGDLIVVLDCAPETKTAEIYGGAENANVKGNVELTITSGSFGKVFGGNNQSGAIFGHIILNVEETSCRPIVIDELYGCGNNAAYSVYGYKDGGTDADGYPIYIPRTSKTDGAAVTFTGKPHTNPGEQGYDNPQVNIISCTRIGKVFGGGLGSGATVYGNPTVNINQIYGKAYVDNDPTKDYTETATTLGVIGEVFGGGNEANVVGNTNVNIGTRSEVWLHQSVDGDGNYTMYPANTEPGNGIPVVGANITGNVYGGGNEAEVTGNTNVNIGKKSE